MEDSTRETGTKMGEVFPISCISCRRKKIKCNKTKPCNQCEKRQICCNFPSTFRNIKINEDELDSALSLREPSTSNYTVGGDSSSVVSSKSESENSTDRQSTSLSTRKLMTLSEEVSHLKSEKAIIAEENSKLKKRFQQLLTQVSKYRRASNSGDADSCQKDPINISGETSELGEKYYGPLSSDYMIKNLDKDSDKEDCEKLGSDSEHGLKGRKPSSNGPLELFDSYKGLDNEEFIRKSLLKKPLPYLLNVGSGMEPHRDTNTDLNKLNFDVICKLVDYFFSYHSYYRTFISKQQIIEFLNNYDSMKENEWENDDELLLLIMVLVLLIQRLTAKEFIEINILGNNENQMKKFKHVRNHLSEVLFHRFEKIRHNLINEAITTIQAYILCTEWHFIEQRYEECWSMMFHTCSISYSIGLHVMGKFGLLDDQALKEKEQDISRYKVWFALKNISGQICSVLGRPNPISIHVNTPMLKASNPDHSNLDLDKYKMLISLKVGLSECLKLSNMMLIENFMIDFSMKDLLDLDAKFKEDIGVLKWFINDKLYENENLIDEQNRDMMDEGRIYDETNALTLAVDKPNLLIDLITFYINRAKLFQPFIVAFEDENDTNIVIELLHDSIVKFLDCAIYFINLYLKQFGEKYKEDQFKYLKIVTFGKLLRNQFPFLNSFIYQGMLVIFTLLHQKFKTFVEYQESSDDNGINYSEFLKDLDDKLNTLWKLEINFARMTANKNKLWSSNITYLIRINLQHIERIRDKQTIKIEIDRQTFESDIDELQNQINLGYADTEFHGFNLRDPFWITNPDNLPYHLSSPSDDDKPSLSGLTEDDLLNKKNKSGSNSTLSNKQYSSSSSFSDQPKHPQPLHSSHMSSNMLIDNFDSQNNTPFDNIWNNNNSFPSKSSSLRSRNQPQDVSLEEPTIPGSYNLNFTQPPNSDSSQLFRGTINASNYHTHQQIYPSDIMEQENTTIEDNKTEFNPDMF